MYILSIGGQIHAAARALVFSIFSALLKATNVLYSLFKTMAQYQLFTDASSIMSISYRIGLLLGVFMVFRLSFSAIQYIVDPDSMSDKQKGIGNIVKKVLIVIILLGSVRFLFDKARDIQRLVLQEDDNLIAKVILGSNNSGENTAEIISSELLNAFYYSPIEGCNIASATEFDEKLEIATTCMDEEPNDDDEFSADFQWLFGIGCSAFILWVIAMYTIQLGVRCFQLIYLEIISPIPIMMYLNPKGDESLKKWANQCLSTFIDVFIRVAIIYFIIYMISYLADESENLFYNGLSIGIVLIIGLMIFAQRLPNLLKELFPSIGGGLELGFKVPKEAKSVLGFGAGAVGGALAGGLAGAITGEGVKGRLGGFAKGTLGGIYNGAMPKKKIGDTSAIKDFNTRRKDINQNRNEQKDRTKLLKEGAEIASKYRNEEGKLTDKAFKNSAFKNSWNKVNEAKGKLKEADYAKDIAYEAWKKNQTAENRTAYENAISRYKAADAELNEIKKNHENNRKIYIADARNEDAYEYYDHLNPYIKENNQYEAPIGPPTPEQHENMINNALDTYMNPDASEDERIRASEILSEEQRRRQYNDNNNNNNNN